MTVEGETGFEHDAQSFDLGWGNAETTVLTTKIGGSAIDVYADFTSGLCRNASDVLIKVYGIFAGSERLLAQANIREYDDKNGARLRVRARAEQYRVAIVPTKLNNCNPPFQPRTTGKIAFTCWGWEPAASVPPVQGCVPFSVPIWSGELQQVSSGYTNSVPLFPGPVHVRQLLFNLQTTGPCWVNLYDGRALSAGAGFLTPMAVKAARYVQTAGDAIDFDFRDPHAGSNDGLPFVGGCGILCTSSPAVNPHSGVAVGLVITPSFSWLAETRGLLTTGLSSPAPYPTVY